MEIRKGKISDAKQLLKLLNSASELQASKKGKTYSLNWIKGSLQDDFVLIAEEKNKIIGFLIAELLKKKKYSFFSDIYVDPKYRKKGLASILLQRYKIICKKFGLKTIVGFVLVTNRKMQKWCKKHDFKKGNQFYIYEKKV